MPEVNCGFVDVPGGSSGVDLLEFYGPTVIVDIGFDSAYQTAPKGSVPISGMKGIQALVDTGATESCIDSQLAAQLNLPIVDRRFVSGANGSHEVNVHLAQVFFPALNFVLLGAFAAVDLAAGGQVHKALIGRSFLRHYTLIYEGRTGVVRISSV